MFGVPIEATVQREQSGKAVPLVLVRCADYLVISGELAENYTESFSPFRVYHYGFWIIFFPGLNNEYLFKSEGDKKVLQQLVSLYNEGIAAIQSYLSLA